MSRAAADDASRARNVCWNACWNVCWNARLVRSSAGGPNPCPNDRPDSSPDARARPMAVGKLEQCAVAMQAQPLEDAPAVVLHRARVNQELLADLLSIDGEEEDLDRADLS